MGFSYIYHTYSSNISSNIISSIDIIIPFSISFLIILFGFLWLISYVYDINDKENH